MAESENNPLNADPAEPSRIVVLISGSGSNMQAIAEACAKRLALWNEATRVENKPSREGASYAERVADARRWAAEKNQKEIEFLTK